MRQAGGQLSSRTCQPLLLKLAVNAPHLAVNAPHLEAGSPLARLLKQPRPRLLALLSLQGNSSDALQLLQNLNISHSGLTGTLPPWGAPDYPGLQQLTTLTLHGNNLTGAVPASWGNLAQLSRVTLLPGNPGLCVHKPAGTNFKVCQAEDQLCRPVDSASTECAATGSSGGSSSFPVAAVAVPVAVVGALALAAGGFLVWRKRQQQAAVEPSSTATPVYKAGYRSGGAALLGLREVAPPT